MELQKAYFNVTENEVRLSMPLQKVDKKARTVSGFASLDNVDSHDDVVTHEANKKAFGKFRGNLRLMHQPIPAGKLLSFREDEYYDTETKKFYNGIYVTAYISKGAESIWEMVLDGTLTGFSIGGTIKDTESKFVKDAAGDGGKQVRFIKDYDLVELSLVDNPANQLANLVSIQKLADGQVEVTGTVADAKIENVFYCKANDEHNDRIVPSNEETLECSICGKDMENAGWYESVSDEERAEKVSSVITKFLAPESEGGVDTHMTIKKSADEEVETVAVNNAKGTATDENGEVVAGPSEAVEVPEVDETKEVEAVEVDEVEQPTDFAKMLDGALDDLKSVVEKSATAQAEALTSLETRINEVNETFTAKFTELEARTAEVTEKFNGLNAEIEKMAGKVETVASETAVRKSNDLGGSEDSKLEKGASSKQQNFWGRAFSVDTDLV